MTDLIGYQIREDWMGAEVLTLADLWPAETRAMIVGLNPAPASVTAGHYYQGQVGQTQLRRLASAGLFRQISGRYFEEAAIESGTGFTDIVKRPVAGKATCGRTRSSTAAGYLPKSWAAAMWDWWSVFFGTR